MEVFRGVDGFEDPRLATEIWENEGNARMSSCLPSATWAMIRQGPDSAPAFRLLGRAK
ncbi:MAG: hypothetical protein IPH20_25035 [Bacteroidales bacterium]|nr:hypothetical protein [Bacteroidales bacterium]